MRAALDFVSIARGMRGKPSNPMLVPGRQQGPRMKALKTRQFWWCPIALPCNRGQRQNLLNPTQHILLCHAFCKLLGAWSARRGRLKWPKAQVECFTTLVWGKP